VSENPGCLGVLLRMFGGSSEPPAVELPYRLRDDFLSAAELSFYRVLRVAAGDSVVVCPKVNLADVLFVVRRNENQGYRNKIDRKHVDFLLCDAASMRPLLGVELDDKSHQRADRQARDAFVDEVFRAAGLPLLHMTAQSSYGVGELAASISSRLGPDSGAVTPPAAPTPASTPAPATAAPVCPKCGTPMLARTASRGERQGERFWGCANYPKCRETRPMDT
jgi:Protein of unknown function (DUF2726)/Topoisomerase DNA binding C4 zinc finger